MRTKHEFGSHLLQSLLLLVPLVFGSGCATHALLTEVSLDAWNEPAAQPNLRLYRAERKNDVLVVYDEYRERLDTIRTRAYLLDRNLPQVQSRERPQFVRTNLLKALPPVPILQPSILQDTPSAEKFYAIAPSEGTGFRLFLASQEVSSNELPVYNDGLGKVARVALTPISVLADVTIIGGFIFLWAWSAGGLHDVH